MNRRDNEKKKKEEITLENTWGYKTSIKVEFDSIEDEKDSR